MGGGWEGEGRGEREEGRGICTKGRQGKVSKQSTYIPSPSPSLSTKHILPILENVEHCRGEPEQEYYVTGE